MIAYALTWPVDNVPTGQFGQIQQDGFAFFFLPWFTGFLGMKDLPRNRDSSDLSAST
jgi:hypothetical protein